MNKLKNKKGIVIGVVGFIVASTITGIVAGVAVNKQAFNKKQAYEFETSKNQTINKIKALDSLNNKEIAKFFNEINKSKIINDLNKILTKAIETNNTNKVNKQKNDLIVTKSNSKVEINGLAYLTWQQKQSFNVQIDQAESKQKVELILNDAKKQNEVNKNTQPQDQKLKDLKNKKSQANTTIEQLNGLTSEQKTNYKNEINAANLLDSISSILNNARKQNEANKNAFALASKKTTTKSEIDKLSNLEQKQKADFSKRIDEANLIETIESILKEATQQNESNKKAKTLNNSSSSSNQNNYQQPQNHQNENPNTNKPNLNNQAPNDQQTQNQKLEEEKKALLNEYNNLVTAIKSYIQNQLSDQKYSEIKTVLEKVISETQSTVNNSSITKEQLAEVNEKLMNARIDAEKNKNEINKDLTARTLAKNEYNSTKEKADILLNSLNTSSDFDEIKQNLIQEYERIEKTINNNETKESYQKAKNSLERAISNANKQKELKENEITKAKQKVENSIIELATKEPEITNSRRLSEFLEKLKNSNSLKEINDLSMGFKNYTTDFQNERKKYQDWKKSINEWINKNLNESKYSEIKTELLSEIDKIDKNTVIPNFDKDRFTIAFNQINAKKQEAEIQKNKLESRRVEVIAEINKISNEPNALIFKLDNRDKYYIDLVKNAKNIEEINKFLEEAKTKIKEFNS